MSEEEIIQTLENMLKSWDNIRDDCKDSVLSKYIEQIEKENKAIQDLLDLYNKQKEEIKELNLENQAFYEEMNCDDNEYISKKYSQLKENSISKDKILKALGYEENDEEYKRIYNKEEMILTLIRTINAECYRLEDIEDRKTMVEVNHIENMRDKYWQDKIRERLEKLKEKEWELSDEQGYWGGSELQAKIEELEELLEENEK